MFKNSCFCLKKLMKLKLDFNVYLNHNWISVLVVFVSLMMRRISIEICSFLWQYPCFARMMEVRCGVFFFSQKILVLIGLGYNRKVLTYLKERANFYDLYAFYRCLFKFHITCPGNDSSRKSVRWKSLTLTTSVALA